ncbi:hypothetical protein GCM10027161_08470 [Microbispora hainanensis]
MSAEAPDPIGGGGFRYQFATSPHLRRHGRAGLTGGLRSGSLAGSHPAHWPVTGSPFGKARRTRPRLTSVSSGDDGTP